MALNIYCHKSLHPLITVHTEHRLTVVRTLNDQIIIGLAWFTEKKTLSIYRKFNPKQIKEFTDLLASFRIYHRVKQLSWKIRVPVFDPYSIFHILRWAFCYFLFNPKITIFSLSREVTTSLRHTLLYGGSTVSKNMFSAITVQHKQMFWKYLRRRRKWTFIHYLCLSSSLSSS